MVVICTKIEEVVEEVGKKHKDMDLTKILSLDFPFLSNEDNAMLISIPSYGEMSRNLIYSSKETFVLTSAKIDSLGNFKKILNKKYGESTVATLLILKSVLRNYSQEFGRIREEMNRLEIDPRIEIIEEKGRELRKLTDKMEGLFQLIIELKERDIQSFDTALIPFEYDLLNVEARYLLERCRSHVYRIASLRTKSEMQSNRELNDTMKKLTVIMTFLSIAGIVVNVPGTVGAIFGIPALSDAFFKNHTIGLVVVLFLTTFVSILLGYLYWRALGFRR